MYVYMCIYLCIHTYVYIYVFHSGEPLSRWSHVYTQKSPVYAEKSPAYTQKSPMHTQIRIPLGRTPIKMRLFIKECDM